MAASPLSTATALQRPPDLPKPTQLNRDTKRGPFSRRLTSLKKDRDSTVWDEWQEITTYIRPRRGVYMTDPQNRERRSKKIINSRATVASRTCGAGMMSGVSSPARPWFMLQLSRKDLNEVQSVKQWLYQATTMVQLILAKSNFYDQIQVFYRDLADFGNACMIIDEDYEDVIRCTVFAPGEYYFANGEKGRVNTVYREYKKTVLALVQEYGIENVSKTVRDRYNKGGDQLDDLVECVMAIEPNMQQLDVPGPRSWPWIVVYFEKTVGEEDKDKILRRSGYREWPVAAPRWEIQAGETYGSGPGLDALGDAKSLQIEEKEKAKLIQKIVTPPVQSPAGPSARVLHVPGGVTHLPTTSAQNAQIRELYQQNPNGITALREDIMEVEKRIDTAYFADLFLMLAQSDRREITAREVDERHEEKLLALGPVLERLHNEALNVVVTRTFMIAYRAGLIPPPPREAEGQDLKVEYTSILAQAQQAVAIAGIERFIGIVGSIASAHPDVLDKVDFDQVVDEVGMALRVPPAIIVADDIVEQRRQDKAQQQNMMMAAAGAQPAADAAKTLSETRLGTGSALDILTGQPTLQPSTTGGP